MASAYTSIIGDKDNVSFRDFALRCTRAFIYAMRDDPLDAEIPREYKPSDYHLESLTQAKNELEKLTAISDADFALRAETDYHLKLEHYANELLEKGTLASKYVSMLKEVKAWQPPTVNHENLKRFMISQLEESINGDCSVFDLPDKLTGSRYKVAEMARLEHEIQYHETQYEEEVASARKNTEWIQKLYASLESKQNSVAEPTKKKPLKKK